MLVKGTVLELMLVPRVMLVNARDAIVEGLFDYFFAGLFTVRVATEENLHAPYCGPIRWDI